MRSTRQKKIELDAEEVIEVAVRLRNSNKKLGGYASIDQCVIAAALIVTGNRISARRSDG